VGPAYRVQRWLLGVAVITTAMLAVVVVSGGFSLDLGLLSIRVHNPLRPSLLAAASTIAYLIADRRRLPDHWRRLGDLVDRGATPIAIGLSVVALCLGVRFGTFSAGSADSYGYVSQADLWLAGSLVTDEPLAHLPIADAELVFSPLGYRPATTPHHIVPTYAPGLPLLMAMAKAAGGASAVYYVVPLLGGALVWATFRLGALVASPRIGLAASVLLLTNPTFLFQLMWPMSDVPVAALWMLSLVTACRGTPRSSLIAGLIGAAALAVRPNLLLVAAALALWIPWIARDRQRHFSNALLFGVGLAPAICAIAFLNWRLYGAPWTSGYGALSATHAWANIPVNVVRYTTWFVQTQGWASLAWVGMLLPLRWPIDPVLRAVGATLIVALWATYMPYLPFDEWWFLRFLLPAIPVMIVFAMLVWQRAFVGALGPAFGPAAVIACIAFTLAHQAAVVRASPIFLVQAHESRYERTGAAFRGLSPVRPVCIAMQHSGGLRHYAGCPTARYDQLPDADLCAALRTFRAAGLHAYVVLDDWERAPFQQRFALPQAVDLWPWPVRWRGSDVTIFDAGPSSPGCP
jgi:hypothetical protein